MPDLFALKSRQDLLCSEFGFQLLLLGLFAEVSKFFP